VAEFIQVTTTVSKREDAGRISRAVVEKRLAACAQVVGPITSIYRWKGKIERAKEWMVVMKTRKALYPKLEKAIREVHPYEVPEIVATRIEAGSRDYLDWIRAETG
jgi:periplasmic divalent cation tolerance protein